MQDVYSISGLGMVHRDGYHAFPNASAAFGLRREGLGRMQAGDFWWQQKDFSRAPNWQLNGAATPPVPWRKASSFVMTGFGATFFDHPRLGAMYYDSSRITRRIGAVFGPDQQGGPGGALLDPSLATDNGDGTFTCVQDGSQVSDPSQCPQPTTLVNPFPNQTVVFPGGGSTSTDSSGNTTVTQPDGTTVTTGPGPAPTPQPAPAPFPQFGPPASGGVLANGALGLSKNELLFVGALGAGILGYAYFGKKKRGRRRRG